jgi:hypothetical protein
MKWKNCGGRKRRKGWNKEAKTTSSWAIYRTCHIAAALMAADMLIYLSINQSARRRIEKTGQNRVAGGSQRWDLRSVAHNRVRIKSTPKLRVPTGLAAPLYNDV